MSATAMECTGASVDGALATHATLDMNARAMGHADVPVCPRKTSAAAASTPWSMCRAAHVPISPL
jgi:hypothetical protein